MPGAVSVAFASGLATLTLSNPEKLNALSVSMWRELRKAFDALAQNGELRCVAISGAGEAFAAGADISEFAEARLGVEQVREYHEKTVPEALSAIRSCPVPVVAAIRGACVGGGLEIALACDIRLSAESGRFGAPVGRLGFPMAYGELELLLRFAGPAVSAELLLEGRIFTAFEAQAMGLVGRVVRDRDLEAELGRTVERILAGAPLAARWHKQQIRRLMDNPAPVTREERLAIYRFAETEDYRIGFEAFLAKRRPEFVGR